MASQCLRFIDDDNFRAVVWVSYGLASQTFLGDEIRWFNSTRLASGRLMPDDELERGLYP